MSRWQVEQEMVEARFPHFTTEVKNTIRKISIKKSGEAKRDLVDALCADHADVFGPIVRGAIGDADTTDPDTALAEASRAAVLACVEAAENYADVLLNLSDEELTKQYSEFVEERETQRTEKRRAKAAANDRFAFFQSPLATADFDEWCIKPIWSPEEAVALSLEKDPTRVNLATLEEFNPLMGSAFKSKFLDRCDQVRRGIEGKKLEEPITPKSFLEWAMKRWDDLPKTLMQTVRSSPVETDKVSGKKLHSLYRIILGFAIKHHGLDATDNGSLPQTSVVNAIVDDFKALRIDISARTVGDTIRDALQWAHVAPDDLVTHARKMKPTDRSRPSG